MTASRTSPMRGLYILNTDGGMAPGHGLRRAGDALGDAAIGAVLRTPRLEPLVTISKVIGPATHNEAEYRALITGLEAALEHGIRHLRAYMDSALVVDQLIDESAVKQPHLAKLHATAIELGRQFTSIRFAWVPRELNREADQLARDAFSDRG